MCFTCVNCNPISFNMRKTCETHVSQRLPCETYVVACGNHVFHMCSHVKTQESHVDFMRVFRKGSSPAQGSPALDPGPPTRGPSPLALILGPNPGPQSTSPDSRLTSPGHGPEPEPQSNSPEPQSTISGFTIFGSRLPDRDPQSTGSDTRSQSMGPQSTSLWSRPNPWVPFQQPGVQVH